MRIWNWMRRRTLRRWRRYANRKFVKELDRKERINRNLKTALESEKAKVKVQDHEIKTLYAVIARNHTRVEADTAVAAKQIADLTGVDLAKRP